LNANATMGIAKDRDFRVLRKVDPRAVVPAQDRGIGIGPGPLPWIVDVEEGFVVDSFLSFANKGLVLKPDRVVVPRVAKGYQFSNPFPGGGCLFGSPPPFRGRGCGR